MNLNYPYENEWGQQDAPMWYAATPDAMLRDMIVPPVYAPYPMRPFWPPSLSGMGAQTGDTLDPISLVPPMPSIVTSPLSVSSDMAPVDPMPTLSCRVADWVNANPIGAALLGAGVFWMFSRRKR